MDRFTGDRAMILSSQGEDDDGVFCEHYILEEAGYFEVKVEDGFITCAWDHDPFPTTAQALTGVESEGFWMAQS